MSELNPNNYKRVFLNTFNNQISHSSSNNSNSKHIFQVEGGRGLITGFLHIFHSKIHKLLTLFASCFKIQRPSLTDTHLRFLICCRSCLYTLYFTDQMPMCVQIWYTVKSSYFMTTVYIHITAKVWSYPASQGIAGFSNFNRSSQTSQTLKDLSEIIHFFGPSKWQIIFPKL